MKKSPLGLFVLIFTCFLLNAKAQIFENAKAAELIHGANLVRLDENRKTVSFVKLNVNNRFSESEQQLWLEKTVLKLSPGNSFSLLKSEYDNIQMKHNRFKQYYNSVPVEYAVFYIHVKGGLVESANGEVYDVKNLDVRPGISRSHAFDLALDNFPATLYKDEHNGGIEWMEQTGELVIYPVNNNFRLAYKFDIYAHEPEYKRAWVYIDAKTGEEIVQVNRIHTADVVGTATTAYCGVRPLTADQQSASLYRLRQTGRGNGIQTLNLNNGSNYPGATDFTDTDNNWQSATLDRYAYDAHVGAEATYDFFFTRFGRNSIDNAGFEIRSYVHYGTSFVNAFWDGSQMTYGDGDGTDYTPLTTTDIVGHEITHGLTEFTAGLIYSGESGALNESFSDVMGITIDHALNPTTANFLEGEQCSVTLTPFRNMGDPNEFQCADTYGGLYWNFGDVVHYDSGVQNFWYYLLCNGGVGTNDNSDAYTVNSIGMTDASAVAYRNLTVYLTPSSNFADARFYAIQAAIDLFGNCSSQVIEVTNAWHAVGVGAVFSNAVIAQFSAPQLDFCVLPATVNFINTSLNSTTYLWNFGDGGTSTSANPSHTYTSAGSFTVTLYASGSTACSTSDTLVQNSYIDVSNGGGPITANCTPGNTSNCCNIGIREFHFGTINSLSGEATEGYKDFTCTYNTTLTAGDAVPISVLTSTQSSENVKAWIDYNNDGVFATTELVFSSMAQIRNHSGVVSTPTTAVLNTPLRMRVSTDISSNTSYTSCSTLQNGQAEDYTVTFTANTVAPVVDFYAQDTLINPGSSTTFYDMSIHAPTSWQWTFPGGTPSSSTQRNPVVTYSTVGTYPATLVVSNSFGNDSITKITYIDVVSQVYMCSGPTTTVAPNGQLYDSGGPTGEYQDNEFCTLLINPGCAISITLTFASFNTESGYDYLRVYDGSSTTGTLLMNISGSSFPPPVTANSGQMYIVWDTDGSVTDPGFSAAWASNIVSSNQVVAAYAASTITPPLNSSVDFTDNSTNGPSNWQWDFGDGGTSILQNPSHAYSASGSYQVRLIASNCSTIDTTFGTINVQLPPDINVSPASINTSLSCGDSLVVPITISNTGNGQMEFEIDGLGSAIDTVRILAFVYGADMATEYPNTIAAIGSSFSNYTLTQFVGTDSASLRSALAGKNVLLFPEQESGSTTIYAPLTNVVNDFLNAGNTVIICGTSVNSSYLRLADMNLFAGSYISSTTGGLLVTNDTTDAITDQVPLTFTSPNLSNYFDFTNPDRIELVSYNSYDVVSYRNIGSGKVIYVGFDFYLSNVSADRIMSNAVRNSTSNSSLPDYLSVSPTSGTVNVGASSVIYVTINTAGMPAGTYNTQFSINSNDPTTPSISFPIQFTVSGSSNVVFSDTCSLFSTIMQFGTERDTITIMNTGCDTLMVSSISSSETAFTFSPSTFSIPNGGSASLIVTFNPQSIGSYSGNLTLNTNDGVQNICLTGAAGAAPVIDFYPSTITSNLNACNDSITIPLWVINRGGSDLDFEINGGSNSGTRRVLAMVHGVDMTREYPNTINSINSRFTGYTLDSTFTTDPVVLQSLLSNYDILLFPEQENSAGYYASIASVVQNFANDGGVVITCGAIGTGIQTRVFEMGLFTGSYIGNINSGGNCIVNDTTSDYMNNVTPTFAVANSTFFLDITNSDKVELVSYNGNDVVTYRDYGSGRVMFVGFDYYDTSNANAAIISNAIRYADSNGLPDWLSIDLAEGTVTPSDSILVYVTLNSSSLPGGTYSDYIYVNSNDPLHPVDSVPVILNVGFNPCADFEHTDLSSCTGIVNFTDISFNNPTSWSWTFGDGGTSTQQNPSHTYSTNGLFNVKLISCNTYGCDSITVSITVSNVGGPLPAVCIPVTTGYCCGMGIADVDFNTIHNSSNSGIDSYEDFTCTISTDVNVMGTYNITVTTGFTYSENVVVFIDYNNDGAFNVITEKIFESIGTLTNHTGSVTIPSGAVVNTPLRMRVMSDYYTNSSPLPCTNIQYGQTEDYTIFIRPNSIPPVAGFEATVFNACTGEVHFADSSINYPTAWLWDFGDGTTSTLQNPVHNYSASGTYNVTLTATNPFGTDSQVSSVTVQVTPVAISITGIRMPNEVLQFNGTSAGATSYSWDFGDGYFAGLQNPTHTYTANGIYIVALTVQNGSCNVTKYDTLEIGVIGVEELLAEDALVISPNPFSDEVSIFYSVDGGKKVTLQITDIAGRLISNLVLDEIQSAGTHKYTFKGNAEGVYLVHLLIGEELVTKKVVKVAGE
jgi:Zn-dependent metalloprotease